MKRNVLVIFLITSTLWVLPSLLKTFGIENGVITAVTDRLNEGAVVVLAAMLFFLPRGDGSGDSTLTWPEATQIDWGTVVLVGAGLTIGTMMNATGLAETFSAAIADATGVQSSWVLALIAIVMALLISETTSNTLASASSYRSSSRSPLPSGLIRSSPPWPGSSVPTPAPCCRYPHHPTPSSRPKFPLVGRV